MSNLLKDLGIWNPPSLGGVIHCIAGFLTALSCQICFILPVILYFGFRDYELNEEGHIHDMAFKDIQEFVIGLFLGTIFLLLFMR
jgi:hypothetical protein